MSEGLTPTRTPPGRSCTACRRRKIRCDQQRPCAHCSRLQQECIYGAPVRETNKASGDQVLSRLTDIQSTLRRIEANIPSIATAGPLDQTRENRGRNASWITEAEEIETRSEDGRFISEEGDSRYVTGGFWTKLDDAGESADISQHTTIQATEAGPSSASTEQVNTGFSFSLNPSLVHTWTLHPPEPRIVALWQVFVDSVDPILKVVHVPTTQQQLGTACQDLASTPPAFESLMFAIYYSAICSMRWSVSYETLPREERRMLLDRYRGGLEQALTRANVLTAPNVTTLQALTIYLTCARHIIDKAYVWTMTGLLVRLAMKLGLHHDPMSLDISLFASEMRRRLWWTIVVLDILTAEAYDTEPLIPDGSYDTKLPTSLNDADLSIDMSTLPSERQPALDMLFSFVRFEYTTSTHRILFPVKSASRTAGHNKPTMQERNEMIDKLSRRLDEKHLVNCDENLPIVFLARNATKLVIAKTRLTLNCPTRAQIPRTPHAPLAAFVKNATDIVHFTHELRTHKRYSHWIWLFGKYIEWDAVAFLLQILRTVPSVDNSGPIWNITEAFFQYWSDWVPTGERRWFLLQNLRRDAAMKQGINVSPMNTNVTYSAASPSVEEMSIQMIQDIEEQVTNKWPSGIEDVQQSTHAQGSDRGLMGGSTAWTFDDTQYRTQTPVDWDMYLDDDALTAAYFKERFSRE